MFLFSITLSSFSIQQPFPQKESKQINKNMNANIKIQCETRKYLFVLANIYLLYCNKQQMKDSMDMRLKVCHRENMMQRENFPLFSCVF